MALEEDRMPEVQTVNGVLHYDVVDLTPPWITDPPVIVFHHGVGATSGIWSGWLPVLADAYRLVRFDMRGFGRSHRSATGHAWTFDGMVDDLFAVADAAEAERFHLVGESIGGTIALHAAATRGEALLSVTGVSCAHRGAGIGQVHAWRDEIAADGLAGWSRRMMPHRFHDGAIPQAAYDWFERQQADGSPDAVLGLADMLVGADLSPLLPDIALPVLLLHPDGSPFVPVDVSAAAHALLPASEMQVVAGARHGMALSHGPECARTLRDFLERRSP